LLETLEIFGVAFGVGFSGAMMPGPLLAFNVHSAAKRGPAAGFLVVVGHGLLESAIVVAIFAGAQEFLTSRLLLRVIAGVGALALLLLGVLMMRQAPRISLSKVLAEDAPRAKYENPVLGGFMLSLFNPTFPLWWATVGLALIARYEATVPNAATFFAGHISSDFTWYVLVACAVGYGRRFIGDRAYRVFIVGCALVLLVFAGLSGWSALTGAHLESREAGPAAGRPLGESPALETGTSAGEHPGGEEGGKPPAQEPAGGHPGGEEAGKTTTDEPPGKPPGVEGAWEAPAGEARGELPAAQEAGELPGAARGLEPRGPRAPAGVPGGGVADRISSVGGGPSRPGWWAGAGLFLTGGAVGLESARACGSGETGISLFSR